MLCHLGNILEDNSNEKYVIYLIEIEEERLFLYYYWILANLHICAQHLLWNKEDVLTKLLKVAKPKFRFRHFYGFRHNSTSLSFTKLKFCTKMFHLWTEQNFMEWILFFWGLSKCKLHWVVCKVNEPLRKIKFIAYIYIPFDQNLEEKSYVSAEVEE